MPLIINGEKINDSLIIAEIDRLRPEYQRTFREQPPEMQEAKLLDWAKENIIERVLLQQYAKKDQKKISPKRINNALKKLKKQYGGKDKLYESLGIKNRDEQKIKKEIEQQLRIERTIQEVIKDLPSNANNESKNKKIEEFIDELKKSASIEFSPDEKLKNKLKVKSREPKKIYQKPLNFLLIKPAGPDCNMACTYCFYLEKKDLFTQAPTHRMSIKILEEMIKQAMAQSDRHISFGWQGGEPTLMGLPFFEKAVELQKKYGKGKTIGNGFQTNGILIDKEWARFFKQNDFLIGLSLDGPQHIHDHYRLKQGGEGTWERVVQSAKILLDEHAATNALIVVNDYSAQFPKEVYDFHKDLGLSYMQFIPCVETDPANPGHAAPFSVSAEQYGSLLCALFDLWISDFANGVPTTSVRFFDSVFFSYVNLAPPECTLLRECGIYLVVEHNGDIYSCDFFVEPKWKLGNVIKDKLINMQNSPQQEAFGRNKYTVPEKCSFCRWLKHCRGGCPKDRMNDPADKGVTHFCKSYQMFFEHADEKLKELAVEWKQKQYRENLNKKVF